jgi:hypothetical protein
VVLVLLGLCRFNAVTYALLQETGWHFIYCTEQMYDLIYFDLYRVADISFGRLIAGKSLLLRRVVPILGVPDALVPLDLPVGQINLFPGYISD